MEKHVCIQNLDTCWRKKDTGNNPKWSLRTPVTGFLHGWSTGRISGLKKPHCCKFTLQRIQQKPTGSLCSCGSPTAEKQRNCIIPTYTAWRSNRNSIQEIVQKFVHTKQHNLNYFYRRAINSASYFMPWHSFTYGNNHHTVKIVEHSQLFPSSRTCMTDQTIAPHFTLHWQAYVRLHIEQWSSSWMLDVRSRLAFTNVSSQCMVKHLWTCGPFDDA